MQVFYHLTQGFEVLATTGESLVRCVDDITLQRDLDKSVAPRPGWYRIVSDDLRLLRLILRHADPSAPIEDSLSAVGKLFGVRPKRGENGIHQLLDESQASIALAAPLPGERERACELITAPLASNNRSTLPLLLECACELGFLLPIEGATHLHFDGRPFCYARALAATMNLLQVQREALRKMLGTNIHCQRLGAWPDDIMEAINHSDFRELSWEEARKQLQLLNPSKYCDFNILNLVLDFPDKHTLEVRILPSTLSADPIFAACDAFHALFFHTLNELGDQNGRFVEKGLPASVVDAFTVPSLLKQLRC
jgi:hypothetical protein